MASGATSETSLTGAAGRRPRAAWRRRLRNAAWYRRIKLFLKRLVGREPWLALDARVPLQRYGDWALSAAHLHSGDIVYAIGVGTSLEVELQLVRQHGVVVHAFDPTPASTAWVALQQLPPAVHFHALGAAGRDGVLRLQAREAKSGSAPVMYSAVDATRSGPIVEVPCLTIASLMARLGHAEIALLKMDIEGAEYEVLESLLESPHRPRQILVELHHRFPGIGVEKTRATIAALRAAGYELVFIADTGRELAFLRAA